MIENDGLSTGRRHEPAPARPEPVREPRIVPVH
jgi:hypothetical protein